jgi:hypothetical protein
MKTCTILWFTLVFIFRCAPLSAQYCCETDRLAGYRAMATAYDSALASRIPIITLPDNYRLKSLPDVIDNSTLPYFPGIYAQYLFFSCQQYAGITYTFTYEMNRLRNLSANHAENRYPAHYTWNFLNHGGQFIGVNFLHSFQALMQQGQMSRAEYGPDTAMRFLGWPTGYEKYEKGFPNRIRSVGAIPVNSEEGILTLKHFLNDHLDGSSTGGVACFTAAGPTNIQVIPNGIPEAGKHIVVDWQPWATHGMTIVGYNDSVRFDVNNDGKYTNNLDINGDGIVDVKDWEIGAFKFANSYGTWWADAGYGYALYRSMASQFEQGGVWNNCVYIVEPDPAYTPLLGMEFGLKYNKRSQLRILAGVNTDTAADFPAHTMEFPYFNFQGGQHLMQGIDTIPGNEEIELGLDITPLLSYTNPGQPARYFFIVEENDPYEIGAGIVQHVAFHDYSGPGEVFIPVDTDVPITDQGTTYLSATGTVIFSPVEITTESLPPCSPGQPWSSQLSAAGGKEPYKWALLEQYRRSPADSGYIGIEGTHLWEETDEIPYSKVVLPFRFPFFGKQYDTVYMNSRGMLQFTSDHLPYPYLSSWEEMLRNVPVIFPAFSSNHRIVNSEGDGMWVLLDPQQVTFRWKVSALGVESTSDNSFELVIFPDGSFEFRYGPCVNTSSPNPILAGYSKGDDTNFGFNSTNDLTSLSGQSFRYTPPVTPEGIGLSEDGLLTLNDPDAENICDIRVKVTDEQLFVAEKEFQLSSGLMLIPSLPGPSGMAHFGEPEPVDLAVTNTGPVALVNLQLTLRCSDSLVLISDSTESLQNIGAGELSNLTEAFTFHLVGPLLDETLFYFTIEATAATQHWHYTFPVKVSAPDFRLTKYKVHDGANNLPDPGEIADLEVEIANFGTRGADSVTITGFSSDTSLVILPPSGFDFGVLPSNGAVNLSLRLKASRFVHVGSVCHVTLNVTAAMGLQKQFVIDLQLGSKPVALVNLTNFTSSVTAMKSALDSLDAAYGHYTWVGNHLLNYPVIFLILGTTTGSHFLTDNEGAFFASYLRNGGKMYMESYAEWYHSFTELSPMFQFTAESEPVYSFEEMTGLPGTFLDGLGFLYMGTSNYANFDFLPVSPAFGILGVADPNPHALQIAYGGDDYRTIGSMVEFGKLADGAYPSTKSELMRRYLDFFEVIYKGPYPYFHADSTTLCRFHSVQFIDDSYDNIQSWHWEFPGGEPSTSDLQHPVVMYPAEGKYDVGLTVSDGNATHTLLRKEFIRVEVCAGQEEVLPLSEVLVFPNPAFDVIRILLPGGLKAHTEAVLIDITGRGLKRVDFFPAGSGVTCDLSTAGIPDGLYLLRITSAGESVTRKIIIRKQ